MSTLQIAVYQDQEKRWPRAGRHILAQHDATSIVVYQAYRPDIADYAVAHGRLGGGFSFNRMSWIKPNFLWMMYRCGWCTKAGQERVLAVRLSLQFFDGLLSQSVPSQFDPAKYPSRDCWDRALRASHVRIQWDPDHDPSGRRLERKALQLGLRGEALRRYGEDEPLEITDVTSLATEQRMNRSDASSLRTPVESAYLPRDESTRAWIGLEAWQAGPGQER